MRPIVASVIGYTSTASWPPFWPTALIGRAISHSVKLKLCHGGASAAVPFVAANKITVAERKQTSLIVAVMCLWLGASIPQKKDIVFKDRSEQVAAFFRFFKTFYMDN